MSLVTVVTGSDKVLSGKLLYEYFASDGDIGDKWHYVKNRLVKKRLVKKRLVKNNNSFLNRKHMPCV